MTAILPAESESVELLTRRCRLCFNKSKLSEARYAAAITTLFVHIDLTKRTIYLWLSGNTFERSATSSSRSGRKSNILE